MEDINVTLLSWVESLQSSVNIVSDEVKISMIVAGCSKTECIVFRVQEYLEGL